MLKGNNIFLVEKDEFFSLIKDYSSISVDIGTGDGLFPYVAAKKDSKIFYIGIDPNIEALRLIARKACRKASKGGLLTQNLIFIVSLIENLPCYLSGIADNITINFPWAGLLSGIIAPLPEVLKKIASLGKNGANLDMALNYSIFQDERYIEKLNLPQLTPPYIEEILKPYYRNFNIIINDYKLFQHENILNTTWGKKLILGSGQRNTIILNCTIK